MDGSVLSRDAQGVFCDDNAVAKLQKAVVDVAATGGDFNTLRAKVRTWVEQFVSYPCRTVPTADGVCVHYTTRSSEGSWIHLSIEVPCESMMLALYQSEYAHLGW